MPLAKRSICYTTVPASFIHRSRVVRSNTFCACLEGAHTIEKTIGTLMTVVVSFMHRIGLVVDIKILSCKHRAAEIARRRREIFTLLVY